MCRNLNQNNKKLMHKMDKYEHVLPIALTSNILEEENMVIVASEILKQ
jgi:hypothetical protein